MTGCAQKSGQGARKACSIDVSAGDMDVSGSAIGGSSSVIDVFAFVLVGSWFGFADRLKPVN
ncbi:MAG: hypothetical protein IT449_13915 [Phycisphaerales bacterium]|nr:hypothetical protein [Phycisphaerales bacterium]